MSLEHKAFAFDWHGFERELAPRLLEALSTAQPETLVEFVETHRVECKNPYDGSGLELDWQTSLGAGDVQELADFALTRFYDPALDNGLSETWSALERELSIEARHALLGTAFGPSKNALFDPGRMGAYFQDPHRVRASLMVLRKLESEELSEFRCFLHAVSEAERGLYVTF